MDKHKDVLSFEVLLGFGHQLSVRELAVIKEKLSEAALQIALDNDGHFIDSELVVR